MNNYPAKLKLRLDWSEMDLFGHINNVSYFKYIQSSRVNYWEMIGLTKSHSETGIGPMLASSSCRFFKPLFYPGNVLVQASVTNIGNTSFKMLHQILDINLVIAAEAEDVIVMYNFKEEEKAVIPEDIRKKIMELEGITT
ncbi:acyl-CoA thioesterase [Polluticoccus soli]|uniref:acyl-CoA thioesterase n=1 Tax=Polluticoccus soli TaxID=3034150 RepID=UPI0023E23896|nr:thioesterase family protein [Flavipsychrobacter sp. JY13-12]